MSVRKRKQHRPLRLDDWPGVDERALQEPARTAFRARRKAVELYSRGATLKQIAADSGVHRAVLFRLLDRALCPNSDGRLWGFRAQILRLAWNLNE